MSVESFFSVSRKNQNVLQTSSACHRLKLLLIPAHVLVLSSVFLPVVRAALEDLIWWFLLTPNANLM